MKRIMESYSKKIFVFMDNFIRLTIPFHSQKDTRKRIQEPQKDTRKDTRTKVEILLEYCEVPQSLGEMMHLLNLKNRASFTRTYLKPLIEQDLLEMTIPDQPNNRHQKYVRTRK